jgi:hypothetical protein
MRSLFGLVGLLVVLAIVGILMKKQLVSTQQAIPALQIPAPPSAQGAVASAPASPGATVKEQSQQVQQQYKQAVENALQQSRAIPDDK